MGPNWFEKASEQLEKEYAEGKIDFGEYHNEMRELRRELDEAAREAAQDTYDNYRDGY